MSHTDRDCSRLSKVPAQTDDLHVLIAQREPIELWKCSILAAIIHIDDFIGKLLLFQNLRKTGV